MSAEFGSKCDMLSGSLDEVSRNSIWREHCTKEVKGMKLNTDFMIPNAAKMQVVTEKPNYVIPQKRPDTETMKTCTAKLDELCSTRDRDAPPNLKYSMPVTSAHEYGFYFERGMKARAGMFDHSRHAGDVSKYADSYVTMTGRSPYARAADPGAAQ